MDALFKAKFPNLNDVAGKKTSEPDQRYNCIAWAFGDNQRWWWPSRRAFWPMSLEGAASVKKAFENWLKEDGWESTTEAKFEHGFEKIALYEMDGTPTHAARLLPTGRWTSKLGRELDLQHELTDLEGPEYGAVGGIFKKSNV